MRNTAIAVVLLTVFCSSAMAAPAAVKGRYVHLRIPGKGRTLSLAEVQVFSGDANVALKKKTAQTNAANSPGGSALAVDGNTSGDWTRGLSRRPPRRFAIRSGKSTSER